MRSTRIVILLLLGMLLLAAPACAPAASDPVEDEPTPVETTRETAGVFGAAARTAAAQVGGGAQTAAAQVESGAQTAAAQVGSGAQTAAAQAEDSAQTAAAQADVAAQTAVAQAGDAAGTAMAVATTEGSQTIATARAAAAPHVDYLKEKLASVEPDAEGIYRVTLTEDEVNNVLRLRQLIIGDYLGAGIQSQEVQFREGKITLSGSILEPLPGSLLVIMRPTIEDGRLLLETEEASLAGQEAPEQVLEAPAKALAAAEEALGGTLGEALESVPIGVELLEITAADGELTITGRKIDDGQ